jgi:hypothetical protein
VTFDQFVCLGRCNGAVVDAHRASDVTLEQFRGTVAAVCGQQPMEKTAFLVSRFLILLQPCNASVPPSPRPPPYFLFHIPLPSIALTRPMQLQPRDIRPDRRRALVAHRRLSCWVGYGALFACNRIHFVTFFQVLLLDVARFKYPPHWVPLPLLHESMQAIDAATGRCRGFVLMSRSEVSTSLLLTVSRSKLDKVQPVDQQTSRCPTPRRCLGISWLTA